MSILLQLLAVAMVATGMAWAIVRDAQAAAARKAPDTETATLFRWPWAAYGMLAGSGGLFLLPADMALFGFGWVEEQGGAMVAISLLLTVFGSFVFLYGLLDKYLIHRGRPVQPTPRVRAIMSAFVAGWILLTLVALLGPALPPPGPKAAAPTRVADREGRYSIEVPSGWQENAQLLDQGYAIAVSNVVRGLHLTVLVEDKTDFVKPELRVWATIWGSQFPQVLKDAEMTPWSDTQINGLPAVQCEARGVSEGARVALLLTCIETNEHFCSIQAWTTRSQFDRSRAELERIINTFR
jgi:hypothetical protein